MGKKGFRAHRKPRQERRCDPKWRRTRTRRRRGFAIFGGLRGVVPAEEKVRIVITGLRGEDGVSELCRKKAP